jgi:hypothetical protein
VCHKLDILSHWILVQKYVIQKYDHINAISSNNITIYMLCALLKLFFNAFSSRKMIMCMLYGPEIRSNMTDIPQPYNIWVRVQTGQGERKRGIINAGCLTYQMVIYYVITVMNMVPWHKLVVWIWMQEIELVCLGIVSVALITVIWGVCL